MALQIMPLVNGPQHGSNLKLPKIFIFTLANQHFFYARHFLLPFTKQNYLHIYTRLASKLGGTNNNKYVSNIKNIILLLELV